MGGKPGSFFILIFILAIGAFSCKLESETIDPSPGNGLVFSADTFWFDTIFTDIKTPTLRVRIYNPNDKAVNIKSVFVNGVNGQFPYSFYINGRFGPTKVNDVKIEGKDSAYVLVSAKINPRDIATPFVVKDSLVFEIEGRTERQNVKIMAFGQDGFYLKNTSVECNTVWTKNRPYIIFDTVSVAPGCILTIEKGTKVYGYNSAFFIVRGTLIVKGTNAEPVVFEGVRRENYYADVPGQWGGILIMNTGNAEINHLIQKNSFRGIQVGEVGFSNNSVARMLLKNSFIQNMVDYGILGINAGILSINNQIADCGESGFAGLQGGSYELWHNTFGLSGNNPFQRDGKYQVVFSDNLPDSRSGNLFGSKLRVKAVNNLINGTGEDEIAFGERRVLDESFDTLFFNNILKSKQPQYFINGIANKGNQKIPSNFRFLSPFKYLFAPDTADLGSVFGTGMSLDTVTSRLVEQSEIRTILKTDINDEPRPFGPGLKPDVGAYINQKKKP